MGRRSALDGSVEPRQRVERGRRGPPAQWITAMSRARVLEFPQTFDDGGGTAPNGEGRHQEW